MTHPRSRPRWPAGALLLFLALAPTRAPRAAAVDHVFIFCIDGVRASEGFDAPGGGGLAPLLDGLAPEGSLLTFVENRALTTTLPAHQVYVTGNYADYDTMPPNGDRQYLHPRSPTLFEAYRHQTGADAESCWVVSNTPHLFDTHRSLMPGYGEPFAAEREVSLTGGDSDPWVWDQIDAVMAEHTVDLMLVNLHETDRKAHSDEWGAYTGAMENAASDLVAFWDRLQGDPEYADRTALLVVTDHGRHLDEVQEGWIEHGDECLGCRQTFLLAAGPGIRAGYVGDDIASLLDVAPTVASLLDLDFPHARGRVLTSILEDGGESDPGAGGDAAPVAIAAGGLAVRTVERFDPAIADDQGAHRVVVEVSEDGGASWEDLELPQDGELQHAPTLWSDGSVILAGFLSFDPRGEPWTSRLLRWSAEEGAWSEVLDAIEPSSATPRGGLAITRLDDGMLLLVNSPRERRIRAWTSQDLGRTWFDAPARDFSYEPQRFPRDLSSLRAADGSLLVLFSANVAYDPNLAGPHDNTEVYRLRSTDGGADWGDDVELSDGEHPSIQPRMVLAGDGSVHAVWADMASGVFQIHHAVSVDHGESFGPAGTLTDASVGAWQPALASDGLRPWLAWAQAEDAERTTIRLAAIGDGALADERVLADDGGPAREPSLAYLDDGTILACWSTAADGFDWETHCTRETVAWYPAASASGAVDPVEVEVGSGIQPVVFTAQVTMDETSTGFDRVSVQVPAPFEPAAGIELMVDEETPASAGWASGDTLWCQLEEPIRDGVALRIEASVRPPLEATAPLPFVVRLHNGEDPYVTEVDGELTIAAIETPGDCQCGVSVRGPAGTIPLLLVPFLLVLRRQRRS